MHGNGIAGWENMGMGFKFQMGMGMGMKSLKWEGFVTKLLFPHISNAKRDVFLTADRCN